MEAPVNGLLLPRIFIFPQASSECESKMPIFKQKCAQKDNEIKKYSSSISFAVHKFCNWTGRFHVFLASQSWTSETFFLPASAHIDYAMVIVFLAWHCKLGSLSLVVVEWVASLSWGVTTLTQLFLLRTRFLPAGVETLNDHWKKNTKACWKTHVNSLTKSSASTNEARPATVPLTSRVTWVILRREGHSCHWIRAEKRPGSTTPSKRQLLEIRSF